MNSNEQKHETNPAQLHQGVARIERAFENLAERVEASNERLQRALAQQQELHGFEVGEVASRVQQAAWERGRANAALSQSEQAQSEEAQMAEIHAWADAHRDDAPVAEENDPLEAHKKMWLDGVDVRQ